MNGLRKVQSLGDLRMMAQKDEKYKKLAEVTASNLGHSPRDFEHAMKLLREEAAAVEDDGEHFVVDEVNFCRDLVE